MKTEKEKMISGEMYLSADKELRADRNYSSDILYEYNHSRPNENEKRTALLNKLIHTNGTAYIEPPFHCDYGYNITVGENFYANTGCVILDCGKVTIGKNCMLAPMVGIYAATHPLDAETRNSGLEFSKAITIGDNVWIGGSSVICPGVTIGDNAVIGAGSVVTKDIPSNCIAVGNPARVIKEI